MSLQTSKNIFSSFGKEPNGRRTVVQSNSTRSCDHRTAARTFNLTLVQLSAPLRRNITASLAHRVASVAKYTFKYIANQLLNASAPIGRRHWAPPSTPEHTSVAVGRGLQFVWRPTSVCLMSVAYNGPKSRTERPRKTEIGTEVAHVTRHTWLGHQFQGQYSIGQRSTCRGRGHIVAASRTVCLR